MNYSVDTEFVEICKSIISEGKSIDEWAEIESDDMFQTTNYTGGFDGTEMEFCFSVYLNSKEYWFQLSLDEVSAVSIGHLKTLEIREADT